MNDDHALIDSIFVGMSGGAKVVGSEMASHMPVLFLLARRFSFGEIVELGVGSGFSTVSLLAGAMSAGKGLTSYDVDPSCKGRALSNMRLNGGATPSMWTFRQKGSISAASDFQPGSISLMFLDTVHTLEATRAELFIWLSRIHPDGVVCGHDYYLVGAGVQVAVKEFLEGTAGRFSLQVMPHDQGLFILRPAGVR